MAVNHGGQPYNVLFKNDIDQIVGDDDFNYKFNAAQPYLSIGEAVDTNKGMIQLGGISGLGEVSSNQLQLTSTQALVFKFPTVQVHFWPDGAMTLPGNAVFNAVSSTTIPSVQISSTLPQLELQSTSNSANLKRWNLQAGTGGAFTLQAINDSGSILLPAYVINKTAIAITGHSFYSNGNVITAITSSGATVRGTVNVSANGVVPSPTASGIQIGAGTTYGLLNFFDSSQTTNNRQWDVINLNGAFRIRAKNDAGSSAYDAIAVQGGFGTGVTGINIAAGIGSTTFYSIAGSLTKPTVQIASLGTGNVPVLTFNSIAGPDVDRKKWFISGNNGNFFSYGISNDAGTSNFLAYQAYRGNGTVGGHQWFLGNQGITTGTAVPSMFLANNVFSLMPGVQMVMGDTVPVTSAAMAIRSTTQGFLAPQMTTAQMHAIANPQPGLIVINTTINAICVRFGTSWYPVTAGAPVPEEPIEPEI